MHPQLMRKLSKPSKVASILDWKKPFHHTVLAVNFHKNRVGIAIASHPSRGIPCLELEPLRFEDNTNRGHGGGSTHSNSNSNRKKKTIAGAIDRECLERFSEIIEEYKVCGVVVNWPLQRDTGRMGAACGRVIFALEQLWERSNETITTDAGTTTHKLAYNNNNSTKKNNEQGGLLSRPFCLWDAGHINLADPSKKVDAFGRCASYGKENSILASNEPALSTSTTNNDQYYNTKEKYFASKEQYHEDELTVVLGVWDDFCREHWPDLCAAKSTKSNTVKDEVEEGELGDDDENETTDRITSSTSTTLYSSNLGPPVVGGTPPRQQGIAKNKKSLITMVR